MLHYLEIATVVYKWDQASFAKKKIKSIEIKQKNNWN